MLIDYDHNPALTEDEKLRSLVENLILAFGETTDLLNRQQKQIDLITRAIGSVSDDIKEIRQDVATINSNITTMQGKITALEAIAAEAILRD